MRVLCGVRSSKSRCWYGEQGRRQWRRAVITWLSDRRGDTGRADAERVAYFPLGASGQRGDHRPVGETALLQHPRHRSSFGREEPTASVAVLAGPPRAATQASTVASSRDFKPGGPCASGFFLSEPA